jgi:nucleoid DNA-binding protein
MQTLTKKELARAVAGAAGCTQPLAVKAVDRLFETMREALIRGDRIEIRGFGSFSTRDTNPKPKARNPRTGRIVYIPARRKAWFKPGRELREALHKPR